MSIFKLLVKEEFKIFQKTGIFHGNNHDINSGFIHLCLRYQVKNVSRKYINDKPFLIEINPKFYEIKYEFAKNGEAYPHLYNRALIYESVLSVERLNKD